MHNKSLIRTLKKKSINDKFENTVVVSKLRIRKLKKREKKNKIKRKGQWKIKKKNMKNRCCTMN